MHQKSKKRSHRSTAESVSTPISTSSSGTPRWKQSPVDLNRHFTWMKNFPPLFMNGHWLRDGTAKMTNTGRTVIIELSRDKMPTMRGGPLQNDVFQFMNVQFRWGPTNSRGAEHSIDNIWYSMEAQVMHWNTRYGSIDRCYEKPDGILIISYLMQVVSCPGLNDNSVIGRITEHLPKIKKMGSSTDLPPDCLWWMLEAFQAPGYFTYSGSLTVPPYAECVVWIVLPTAIRISARQIDAFRSLYNCRWENIVKNYRSQHPIHNRRLIYSSPDAFMEKVLNEYSNMTGYAGLVGLPKTGQAPVDIDEKVLRNKRFPPLVINGHWLNDGEAIMSNNGATAKVRLTGDRIPSTISGGPLGNDEYEFSQTHFHWGEDNCRGAEHTINGTWFSMESHVVHWNRKYLSFEECLKHKDGVCVLAFLFLVRSGLCEWDNVHLSKITTNLKHIVNAGTETKIPANSLCWIRKCTLCPTYYSYSGSYNEGTFPECATWIVFPIILPVHHCQNNGDQMLTIEKRRAKIIDEINQEKNAITK